MKRPKINKHYSAVPCAKKIKNKDAVGDISMTMKCDLKIKCDLKNNL
jgi:hypothetical protein